MKFTLGKRWQAVLCALVLPIAALIIQPRLESGIVDDWSYIRMAQVLAKTGHYAYNGWETPMMGYLIFLGALFAKLFGGSFTAVRLANLLIASITGFILQRLFVRWGLSSRNSTIATLALLFCPTFLPYVFTFFTDVPGIFAMAVCFYCGTRALQTTKENHALLWLCLTAFCGVIGGTCRQPAWLGAVAMVPGVAFYLRSSKRILITGAALTLASMAAILALLHWFNHQPYSQPEAILRNVPFSADVSNFLYVATHTAPVLTFLLLPVLIAFLLPALRSSNRSRLIICAGTAVMAVLALFEYHRHSLSNWLKVVPVTSPGGVGYLTFMGTRPPVYGTPSLLAMWIVMVVTTLGFLAFWVGGSRQVGASRQTPSPSPGLSWRQLAWLVLPFTAGYLVLLLPRAVYEEVYNRYLLPLLLLCIPAVVRLYQERVNPRLPIIVPAAIALTGALSIATIHDGFAENRAKVEAYNTLLKAGIPETRIDGGGELNGTAQLNQDGYVHDPRTLMPDGTRVVPTTPDPKFCKPLQQILFPAVKPQYALSFNSDSCGGPADFAPVTYHQWLAPHSRQIFIVKEKD